MIIDKPRTPVIKRPRGSGFLDANASPWATVRIDGKAYGTTPIMGLKLSVGKHRAVFENPDFKSKKTRTFTIRPDKTTRLIVEMP